MRRFATLCLSVCLLCPAVSMAELPREDAVDQQDIIAFIERCGHEIEKEWATPDYSREAIEQYQQDPSIKNAVRTVIACAARAVWIERKTSGLEGGWPTDDQKAQLLKEKKKCCEQGIIVRDKLLAEHPEIDGPMAKYYAHLYFIGEGNFSRSACLRYFSLASGFGGKMEIANLAIDFKTMYRNAPEVGDAITNRHFFLFPPSARSVTEDDIEGWKRMADLLRGKPAGIVDVLKTDDELVRRQIRILSEIVTAWRAERISALQANQIIATKERKAAEAAAREAESRQELLNHAMMGLQKLEEGHSSLKTMEHCMSVLAQFREQVKKEHDRVPNYERIEKNVSENEAMVANAFYLFIIAGDKEGVVEQIAKIADADKDARVLILRAYMAADEKDMAKAKSFVDKACEVDPDCTKAKHMKISLEDMLKKEAESGSAPSQ